ncbi:MAG: hypothetical protein K8I03_06730 [Ignavibacteria bacterium]|nr:hypothetical protein [Ignavibacteria bacterium]
MWSNITGQDESVEKLKSIFKSRKISHAYLFEGTDGIGKDATAIEFAKLLNCTNLINGDEACDNCDNCRKISALRSEYFKLIFALPAGKTDDSDSDPIEKLASADFDAYMEQLELKSENPYYKISLSNANNIRISSIRDLVSRIYLSAPAGITKVFIISEAEKMRHEAANALLKILEEPPKNSVIMLTTSKLNSLPQTIIGRCQMIHFEQLTPEQISVKLRDNVDYPSKQIELASRISFGSYSRAGALLEIGIDDLRNRAIEFMVSLLKNDFAEVVSISRTISAKNDKEKVKNFLFFLNIWIRDLLRVKNRSENGETEIVNHDLLERLIRLNGNFPNSDLFSIILELEEAEKLIGQNVSLSLILINLAIKLKKHFS